MPSPLISPTVIEGLQRCAASLASSEPAYEKRRAMVPRDYRDCDGYRLQAGRLYGVTSPSCAGAGCNLYVVLGNGCGGYRPTDRLLQFGH